MLTAAGGIILAVLFFVFHPQSLVVASALFALVPIIGGAALAVVLVGPWETVGKVASLAGFALIIWYRIMAVSNIRLMMISRVVIPINTPLQIYMPGAERSEDARGIQKFTKSLQGGLGRSGAATLDPGPLRLSRVDHEPRPGSWSSNVSPSARTSR
jgi:hypothetical protein